MPLVFHLIKQTMQRLFSLVFQLIHVSPAYKRLDIIDFKTVSIFVRYICFLSKFTVFACVFFLSSSIFFVGEFCDV